MIYRPDPWIPPIDVHPELLLPEELVSDERAAAIARYRAAEAERHRRGGESARAAREREHPPWQPWPAPEVPMRVVEGTAVPGAVARLLRAMESAGWRAVVTYARGTLTLARDGFTGRGKDAQPKHYPAKIVGSYALRARRGQRGAVAIWHEHNGKLTAQAVLCWGDAPARWVGLQVFEEGL